MKILTVSSVFPPRVIGGAELCAYYLAQWLTNRGHEMGVLTVAENSESELQGELVDSLHTWRLRWPRTHTQHEHKRASTLRKLQWHLQDHTDPRNAAKLKGVLDQFRPDLVLIQVAQGLGHNALAALSEYPDLPVFYFLHDLTLACFRTSMHKQETNCERQCFSCSLSSRQKMKFIRGRRNFHFVSPSAATLETLDGLLDLQDFPRHVVPNLDLDKPLMRHPKTQGAPARLIFVGRLDPIKGVDFVLAILDELAEEDVRFTCTIVGGGPLEHVLRSNYSNKTWVTFTGKIPHDDVKQHISSSDLLLLPSLWRENHPGVVRQALRSGVPVAVSDIGGSKEMILAGESGLVIPTGDHSAWKTSLKTCLQDPDRLEQLHEGAKKHGAEYSVEVLGRRIESLLESALHASRRGMRALEVDGTPLTHLPLTNTKEKTL
jgi:glycosyltransferase involved in cell wall biosynthesis